MGDYAKDVLVPTDWLAEHVADPSVVVAEVDENTDLYGEGHVPGAVELNWREDLQDPVVRDVVDQKAFERLMSARGIGNGTTVVLYGDKNNWFAAYAYWCLKVYGHADVRIVDGGRQKWLDEGRPLSTDVPSAGAGAYAARPRDESIRAYVDDVRAALAAGGTSLLDVRSPQEYQGELTAPPGYEQEGAARAGHIPTAHSVPWGLAVADDGAFRPAAELRDLYSGCGILPERETIVYCRIGERSAHTWFVLRELLGYEHVRNYDGSWVEWGNLVGVPIETGA